MGDSYDSALVDDATGVVLSCCTSDAGIFDNAAYGSSEPRVCAAKGTLNFVADDMISGHTFLIS